jgi:tRNA(adenine34) deaminase
VSAADFDERMMQEALKQARYALDEGEVPVGAVLVFDHQIIARGRNQIEALQDPTAHAEILVISSAASAIGNWRLIDTTLYTTLEPCPMCAGAIFAARIKRVVWGAPDLRLGANGSFFDLFAMKHPMHSVEVTPHVCKAESAALMKECFATTRQYGRTRKGDSIPTNDAAELGARDCSCRH